MRRVSLSVCLSACPSVSGFYCTFLEITWYINVITATTTMTTKNNNNGTVKIINGHRPTHFLIDFGFREESEPFTISERLWGGGLQPQYNVTPLRASSSWDLLAQKLCRCLDDYRDVVCMLLWCSSVTTALHSPYNVMMRVVNTRYILLWDWDQTQANYTMTFTSDYT